MDEDNYTCNNNEDNYICNKDNYTCNNGWSR